MHARTHTCIHINAPRLSGWARRFVRWPFSSSISLSQSDAQRKQVSSLISLPNLSCSHWTDNELTVSTAVGVCRILNEGLFLGSAKTEDRRMPTVVFSSTARHRLPVSCVWAGEACLAESYSVNPWDINLGIINFGHWCTGKEPKIFYNKIAQSRTGT